MKYKYVVIAADVVVFALKADRLQALLIRMRKEPFMGKWALPGGLIGPAESIDDAAKRVLHEKAGIANVPLEQLAAFGEVERDPFGRVVSVAYFGLVLADRVKPATTEEHGEIRWRPIDRLPSLAYDHRLILRFAIKRLRERLPHSNVAAGLMPDTFTLTELQRAYEIILDDKLDKRNFRKRILASDLLRSTGEQQHGERNRPALLYAFAQRQPQMGKLL